jgi:hypothetical protein
VPDAHNRAARNGSVCHQMLCCPSKKSPEEMQKLVLEDLFGICLSLVKFISSAGSDGLSQRRAHSAREGSLQPMPSARVMPHLRQPQEPSPVPCSSQADFPRAFHKGW